ncbi:MULTISPECIES: AAA family ATPase [unclassified Colwellia]|uniref:AAA family ATPase n=1 Tax=unclassified Colwellia TaxID=196834 RepID=UPI0015F6794B|nr:MULTISPECIES: AAA family ATPase [unclassified Colwellia]MBA6234145.1 AAA family ATPase [Colwellia sp. MB02u-7]MBA6237933.1 AAA family ATPase [Colwellia sp. MB02u-11]MBA6257754.1 AAA family ATPase [Colwellia sp. MB3u-28]MBA6259511.1 AAA family ATPase [Colwellia sp. MB3u-41]MBA6300819.1 AAA family ATPase [Colwellia sp. MB3u-22]
MKITNIKKRIVLTGGPGGGKTTALDLIRREFSGKIATVPEAATMIFSGGIERSNNNQVLKAQQTAIFYLQKHLENIQRATFEHSIILCDRGSLDGLAYWPDGPDEFFKAMNTNLEDELARYDAVIFFESAAKSGESIKSNNPIRNESENAAIILDDKLQAIWSQHPNFNLINSDESFINKVMFGITTIEKIIEQYQKPYRV